MEGKKAEVVIIGGGPGGYTAAFRAADLGKKVVLVEKRDVLGGVCLNAGCIPSKALLHAAGIISQAKAAGKVGISFADPVIDLDKLRKNKENIVMKLTKGLGFLAKKRNVTVIKGSSSFISSSELLIKTDNGEMQLTFDSCIIAAGSRPVEIPVFPHDDERVWDSTDALALKNIPNRLMILGGGIIGLEMATVYNALGTEVTVIEQLDQIIPAADGDLVNVLEKRLKKDGVKILTGTKVEAIKAEESGINVSYNEITESFDNVLISVGRRPNSDLLDVIDAGIDIDEQGFIKVDESCKTTQKNIYAIGDIIGQPMLAHKAAHEGTLAAEGIAGLKHKNIPTVIPSVAYTDPEVAWIGITEKEAQEQGIEYTKGQFPWMASGRAATQESRDGFTKLLFEKNSKKIIGAAIIGTHAGELISEAALAINMGAGMEEIGGTIHPHPTLSETIAMAAEVSNGTCTEV